MKKVTLILICVLASQLANAQWWGSNKIKGNGDLTTETRNVGSYDNIAISGFFDVELVKGEEGKITIDAESNFLEYIITEVKNDKLIIKIKNNKYLKTNKKLLITVPFTAISAASLSGSGDLYSKEVITANEFDIKLSGSGDINLQVDTQSVSVALSGSGDISVEGTTQNAALAMTGSGDIDAFKLISKNTKALLSGSGTINAHCNQGDFNAKVSGSGDIYYAGTPSKIDSKVAGSGEVSAAH